MQRFLSHRNSCKKILWKRQKTGIPETPSKTTFLWKIPPENTGKTEILRNPFFYCFWAPKINSRQTGITNLGGTPELGCRDGLFVLKTLLTMQKNHNLPWYVAFVDLIKAYDMAHHDLLLDILEKYRAPPRFVSDWFRIPHMPVAGSLKVLRAPARWGGIWCVSQTKIYNLETNEFVSNPPFSKKMIWRK